MISKKQCEKNVICVHFDRWCMARGVLRGQTNVMSFAEALRIDREEARYFADLLKIPAIDRCYV